jgi:hypothetical protein
VSRRRFDEQRPEADELQAKIRRLAALTDDRDDRTELHDRALFYLDECRDDVELVELVRQQASIDHGRFLVGPAMDFDERDLEDSIAFLQFRLAAVRRAAKREAQRAVPR